jgi:hypothetical protein
VLGALVAVLGAALLFTQRHKLHDLLTRRAATDD